jgi:hypothetical protein
VNQIGAQPHGPVNRRGKRSGSCQAATVQHLADQKFAGVAGTVIAKDDLGYRRAVANGIRYGR